MILILVISIVLRLTSLTQSFWLDEAAQAVISAKSLSQINWSADFQPPFFYVLAHFWQSFGIKDEWFLRLLPVFFGVATVYLTYLFFSKLFGEKVGLVSATLLATAPYHIYFSQEYRMYSFFTFLALASWMALYEKKWLLFVIITTATLYTHYFALLLIASQITYIVWTKRENVRLFAQSLIFSLLLFAPWLPTLRKQIQTAGNLISVWPDWKTVSGVPFLKFPFLLLAKFAVGMTSPPKLLYILVVLITISIFIATSVFIIRKKKSNHILILCYFFIPVIVAWISGVWISANGPWRLLFVLPAFYGIIAVGLAKNEKKANRHSGEDPAMAGDDSRISSKPLMRSWTSQDDKSLKIIFVGIVLLVNITFSLYYLLLPKNHRENWRQAIKYSDKLLEGGPVLSDSERSRTGVEGVVLSEYIGPWSPMVWYSKYPQNYIGVSNSLPITEESIDRQLSPQLLTTNYYLLYTYLYPLSDPSRKVEFYLKNNGYKITEEKDFKGVGIIQVYLK